MTWKRFAAALAFALLLAILIALVRRRGEAPSFGEAASVTAAVAGHGTPAATGLSAQSGPVPATTQTASPDRPALHVSGRVLNFDGTPAGGIVINLSDIMAREVRQGMVPGYWPERGKCDEEGRFRFERLELRQYELGVARGGAVRRVDLKGGSVDGVELRLLKSRRIAVTVVDANGGPVPGARVELPLEGPTFQALTDARGAATLEAFTERVSVGVIDLPRGERRYLLPPDIELDGTESEARFVLEEAAVVSGRVLTPGGSPAQGAYVSVMQGHQELSGGHSGDDGTFELAVPIGRRVSVVFGAGGEHRALDPADGDVMVWVTDDVFVVEPDGTSLRVTGRLDGVAAGERNLVLQLVAVPMDRSLKVKVLSPPGAPLEQAAVKISDDRGNELAAEPTSALGEIEFRNLPAMPLLVEVASAEREWILLSFPQIVPAGQEIVARFRVGIHLEGVVLGPDGQPLDGAMVVPLIKRPFIFVQRVGPDGRFDFLFDPDDPDPLDLEAWAEVDGQELEGRVKRPDPKAGDVTIRLKAK